MAEAESRPENILEIRDLVTAFHTDEGVLRAVDGVSFEVKRGGILGVVGESGCGKSVTSLTAMRLIPMPPGKIERGEVLFDGIDLTKLPEKKMRKMRGNRISMIFQEPMTALNPVYTVGRQITETILLHQDVTKEEARKSAIEMLTLVGIPAPDKRIDAYPHELSGGMRQRVMIAMALACKPELLIADEPTTALDVTIQAQIMDLLKRLQQEMGMSIVLITHDLGVVAEFVDEIVVMYAGKIVERAPVVDLFESPRHPYTIGLLRSVPSYGDNATRTRLPTIEGVVPDLRQLPKGCRFRDRCEWAVAHCAEEEPPLESFAGRRSVACFEADKSETGGAADGN